MATPKASSPCSSRAHPTKARRNLFSRIATLRCRDGGDAYPVALPRVMLHCTGCALANTEGGFAGLARAIKSRAVISTSFSRNRLIRPGSFRHDANVSDVRGVARKRPASVGSLNLASAYQRQDHNFESVSHLVSDHRSIGDKHSAAASMAVGDRHSRYTRFSHRTLLSRFLDSTGSNSPVLPSASYVE